LSFFFQCDIFVTVSNWERWLSSPYSRW